MSVINWTIAITNLWTNVILFYGVNKNHNRNNKQERILVGCVPPAFLIGGGEVCPPPCRQTPSLDADTPVGRMTDASENITLPQTSFAGGKNGYKIHFRTISILQYKKITTIHAVIVSVVRLTANVNEPSDTV